MKRIVPVITLVAIMLCIAKNVEVRASDITNNYDVLALQPGIELTSIIDAYERLTTQQQLIAEYLVGSFNNIYLTARGFKYNIPYDQSNLQAQFSALGSKVFDFITTRIGWKSRVNETFRQYLSGVIIYASQQTQTFANWFQGQVNGTDRQIFIPYSEDAFDAWTTFYNDPSGDGIASFGYTVSEWNSGEYYDFAFVGVPFMNSTYENAYNNFILNNSPVLYGPVITQSTRQYQLMFSLNGITPFDSLYILRGNGGYQYYRFGYTYGVVDRMETVYYGYQVQNADGKIMSMSSGGIGFSGLVYNAGNVMNLQQIIQRAFDATPFYDTRYYSRYDNFYRMYPFIAHVYLVDDITTLANKEEIFNSSDLNIEQPSGPADYIVAPNGRMILPNFPGVPDDPLGFWDLIVDESLDEDGNSVTDDDYHTSIVNNNVINNYYVTDDIKINVPVDWFDNPYTDQLNTDSQDFIGFAKDCIDCLGDFDIYMYGAIVVGLAGGIVKKLLL